MGLARTHSILHILAPLFDGQCNGIIHGILCWTKTISLQFQGFTYLVLQFVFPDEWNTYYIRYTKHPFNLLFVLSRVTYTS